MKMSTLSVRGRKISYLDRGQGKPMILAHCSSACYREWLPLIKSLPRSFRILALDFWGYGKSETFSDLDEFDEQVDYQAICQLLEMCDEPAHLIGHSYGGAIAIEVARTHQHKLDSLTLIEPSCFQILRNDETAHSEWQAVQGLAQKMRQDVKAGCLREGLDIYMKYFLGEKEWEATDEAAKRKLEESVKKVAGEFSLVEYRGATLQDYANINVPVSLLMGSKTQSAPRMIVQLLNAAIKKSELFEIPDAGHMSPLTHATKVVDIVRSTLRPTILKAA